MRWGPPVCCLAACLLVAPPGFSSGRDEAAYQGALQAYSNNDYPQAAQAFLKVIDGAPASASARRAAYLLTVVVTQKIPRDDVGPFLSALPGLDPRYQSAVEAIQQGERERAVAEVASLQLASQGPSAAQRLLAEELLALLSDVASTPYSKWWARYVTYACRMSLDGQNRLWVLTRRPGALVRLSESGEPQERINLHAPKELYLSLDVMQTFGVFSDGSFVIGPVRFAADGREASRYLFRDATDVSVGPEDSLDVVAEHEGLRRYDARGHLRFQVGSRGIGKGQIVYPSGVGTNGQRVVVADRAGTHPRLQLFDAQGKALTALGGEGDRPWPFRGWSAWDVAMDRQGYVYAVDANRTLKIFDPDLNPLMELPQAAEEVEVDRRGVIYCRSGETITAFVPIRGGAHQLKPEAPSEASAGLSHPSQADAPLTSR